MYVTKAEVTAAKRLLFARPRGERKTELDFAIRPISEAWRHVGRSPAFKTATANVAYIWRRPEVADRFGPMPGSFARDYDLRASGLLLPRSAPQWAAEDFRIWIEADEATIATGDPTELSGWHVMGEIPADIAPSKWQPLVQSFLQRELADKGSPVAWAIHAVGARSDGWIIKPHFHAIVAARHYLHDGRWGRRHPIWLAGWPSHHRLAAAWRRECKMPAMIGALFLR